MFPHFTSLFLSFLVGSHDPLHHWIEVSGGLQGRESGRITESEGEMEGGREEREREKEREQRAKIKREKDRE